MARFGLCLALGAACFLSACENPETVVDAGIADQGMLDQAMMLDGGGATIAAFSVVGCDSFSVTEIGPLCIGKPPLTVTFVPLVTGVSNFVWTFTGGDPPTSTMLSPSVMFAKPGSYPVKLAASGPGGTSVFSGTVQVTPGSVGDVCRGDGDCDATSGLQCLCSGGSCAGGLVIGLCTHDCDLASCAVGSLCADLGRAKPPVGTNSDGGSASDSDGGSVMTADPWRRHICLRSCTTDDECRPGLRCLALPTLPSGSYQRMCMAPLIGSIGDACRNADGALDNSRCFSGQCLDIGAYGECTDACSTGTCPTGSACGHFIGTPSASLCLKTCVVSSSAPATACNDALLSCRDPGGNGDLDFVSEASGESCAPKICTKAEDCAPLGDCSGGYCRR